MPRSHIFPNWRLAQASRSIMNPPPPQNYVDGTEARRPRTLWRPWRLAFAILCLGPLVSSAFGQTVYCNAAAPSGGDGSSWSLAFNDLNTALSVAGSLANPSSHTNTAQVLVAEGDYYPGFQQVGTLPSQPEGLTFLVPRGVEVIGAFPKTGNPTSPDPLLARKTILHGDFLSGGVATRANNVVVCDPGVAAYITWTDFSPGRHPTQILRDHTRAGQWYPQRRWGRVVRQPTAGRTQAQCTP